MRIKIDHSLCEGNAVCTRVAPEVFVVDDSERANLLMDDPPEDLRPKVEAAVRRCPRQALSLVD
jgi:ferredoxin